MSWHYLQGGGVAFWPQSSLGGAPSALLSLIPERVKSFSTGNETECLNSFQFGMTCEPSTVGHGEGMSKLSQEDSPARTLASAEQEQALTGSVPDSGQKWQGSFVKFDPESSSWKTHQCSLLGDWDVFSETWPEWGLMQDGECFERPALERPTRERGFTWLLTPTANSCKAWTFRNPLALIRKNHADGNLFEQLMRVYQRMTTPRCQEILMMWPEGWTDSKPLAMDGFRAWLQEHSGCCQHE